jgi:hypothetical protein
MNRKQRRAAKRSGIVVFHRDDRIPVYGPENHVVALVARSELRWYETAENAHLVRDRSGEVIRVNLQHLTDDSSMVVHRGNPRRYSHDHENSENPPRVWMIRRLAKDDTSADRFVQRIFRSSVLDNLKEAA